MTRTILFALSLAIVAGTVAMTGTDAFAAAAACCSAVADCCKAAMDCCP